MLKIKNSKLNRELIFDGIFYVLNQKDLGFIQATHTSFKGVNQVGSYRTNTTLDERYPVITGYAMASNKAQMVTRKREVSRLISPLDNLDLIVNDDLKLEFVAQSTVKWAVGYVENNNFICKFMIDCYCPNPCFIPINQNRVDVALWEGEFSFPLDFTEDEGISMGLRSPSTIVNVNNDGDIKTGVLIDFIANGNLTNPKLLNINTGEFIQVNKSMVAGEIIRVNTNYNQKSVVSILNGVTTDILNMWDLDGTFLQLDVGENMLRYESKTNVDNLEISVNFYPQYFGEER